MARLQKGVNDLETWCLNNGDFGKQLMSEWTGIREDGEHFSIDEVTRGINRKFKWKCSKEHEWYASVNHRTRGRSCPYCSGKRVSNENSLKAWCMSNGLFGQKLMTEWTGECKDSRHYKIDEVSFGSNKEFKWKCSEGHEYFNTIKYKTANKTGCPHCHNANRGEIVSKAKLSNENNLQTWCLNNGAFGEQLKSEWTGIREDGKHYTMDQVARASRKKFKWKCSSGHEWFAVVSSRTSCKSCCPHCSRENSSEMVSKAKLSKENSLKTWCLSNGYWGKHLMTEWTGICEDGKQYKIDEVTRGSKKKLKWICSKGHEWYTEVYSRTSEKYGCPYCTNVGTSYQEQFIYHSLKQIYPSAENRCKVLKSPQNPKGIEFDIGVPEIPLCIEYSSTYWHKGREEKDQYKKDICEKYGIRLIQIINDSYNKLENIKSDNYICFKMNQYHRDEILTEIVDHILKTLGHSISEIDLELVKQKAYESSKGTSNQVEDTAIKT